MTTNLAKLVRRPKFVVPAVSALLGALLAAHLTSAGQAAPQAAAAASCTLNVPTKISLKTHQQNPAHTIGSDCAAAGVIDARWQAKNAAGVIVNSSYFNFDYPTTWYLLDFVPLGQWTWQPAGARGRDISLAKDKNPATPNADSNGTLAIPQNTPTTDIRLASAAPPVIWSFSANCANVTFTASSTRYAAKWDGYVAHTGAPGSIQWRPVDSQTWYDVATFTTDSAGKAVVTRSFPGLGDYRVFIKDTSTVWASSSSTRYIEETC